MATVGTLFINVKARTATFNKKMRNVRATMARLGRGFLNIAKKVAMFGAAISALALVTIALLVKKGLSAVDSIGKLSRAVGTSTEAIITLQHAAQIGGVEVEKMNKSIAKMSKNVGEAAMGTSEITEELKELGLTAQNLEKMEADVMFGTIADAMAKLPSQARRNSVAYKIFGRAGIELNDVLKAGSKGIAKLSKELAKMGVHFSGRQARLVEEANDRWQDLKTTWKGLSDHLAIQFAPLLAEIANRIMSFTMLAGGMGNVAAVVFRSIFMVGAGILDIFQAIQRAWLVTTGSIIQVTADFMDFWGRAFGMQDWIDLAAELQKDAARRILLELELEWNTGQVDKVIQDLIDKIDKNIRDAKMGIGALGAGGVGGGITTLQTAVGGMKTGDLTSQYFLNKSLLKEAKLENSTSSQILAAIKNQGSAVLV